MLRQSLHPCSSRLPATASEAKAMLAAAAALLARTTVAASTGGMSCSAGTSPLVLAGIFSDIFLCCNG